MTTVKFSELKVGAKFTMNQSGTLVKISNKSYTLEKYYGQVKKCKSSGRFFMPKSNPDPDVKLANA